LLGEVPHVLSPCMFIPRLGQIALGQRPNLEIFGKDYDTVDGTAIRDYLHIEDVAEAHVAALEHCPGGFVSL
jgi:UDP-glucose 4-epimerase